MQLTSTILLCAIALAFAEEGISNGGNTSKRDVPNTLSRRSNLPHHTNKHDTDESDEINMMSSYDEFLSIIDYVKSGGNTMQKYPENEDVVLVVGISGAGKSTFVQLLASDNYNLESKRSCSKTNETLCSDEYYITDESKSSNDKTNHSKISKSGFVSHTEIPERTVDPITKTIFYDCPGFMDTRGVKYDIGGTYFIKNITDHAKSVKFIFVTTYPSVTSNEKIMFMNLVKHATNMINNITEFSDGIALVATKVGNLPNDQIINNIVVYLEWIKHQLLKHATANKNKLEFVNVLLTKNSTGGYPKIGFLKQPTAAGPIKNMTKVQENAQELKYMLQNMKYVEHDDASDFGYTILDKTADNARNSIEKMNEKILTIMNDVAGKSKDHCNTLVDKIIKEIGSSDKSINWSEASALQNKLNDSYDAILALQNVINNNATTLEKFLEETNQTLTTLNIGLYSYTEKILTEKKYLKFLTEIFKFNTFSSRRELEYLFENLMKDLENSKNNLNTSIDSMAHESKNATELNIKNSGKKIEEYYYNKEKTVVNLKELANYTRSEHDKLSKIISVFSKDKKCIEKMRDVVNSLNKSDENIISANNILSNATKYATYLEGVRTLITGHSHQLNCADGELKEVIDRLSNSMSWYDFLANLNDTLSKQETNKSATCLNLASNIIYNGEKDKMITDTELKAFSKECYPLTNKSIDNIKLDIVKLNNLKAVIDSSLKNNLVYSCDSGASDRLVIRGRNINVNDIQQHKCNTSSLKFIEIIASNEIIFKAGDKQEDPTTTTTPSSSANNVKSLFSFLLLSCIFGSLTLFY